MSANAICYFSSDKVMLKEVIDLGLEVSICRASLVFFAVLHECISLIRHIIHSECTLYEGFLMVCSAWGGCRPFISVAGRSQHRQGTALVYYIISGDSWRGEVPLWGNGGGWVRGLAVASLSISVSIGSHGSDIWL